MIILLEISLIVSNPNHRIEERNDLKNRINQKEESKNHSLKDSENKQNKGNLQNPKRRRLGLYNDFIDWISNLFNFSKVTNTGKVESSKPKLTSIWDKIKKIIKVITS
jgi:hypothetical protein